MMIKGQKIAYFVSSSLVIPFSPQLVHRLSISVGSKINVKHIDPVHSVKTD
jgi:hypothetical protein